MSEMTAYCGLHCDECKAFKATQTKDLEWKKQIAKHWSDQGEIKFKPEDVDCHGCKSDTISGFCRKLCEIRPLQRVSMQQAERLFVSRRRCNEKP